jgi:hypothetical protein
MKSNVNSYQAWYQKIWESERPEAEEFGLEGGGRHGVIMCKNSRWSGGKWTGAERYYASRGETRPSRGTYDQHIYYSPGEFEGWEQGPAFEDFDTRGLRWYWKDLSGGAPVVILVPGTGEVIHHKSAEHRAYEAVYADLASLPEFQEILKAKTAGKLGAIPKEIIMSLKAKSLEMGIEHRTQDIFDRGTEEDPEFTKAMVKKCWAMGLTETY